MVEKDDRPIETRDDRGPMIWIGAKGYTVKLAKSENPSGGHHRDALPGPTGFQDILLCSLHR